MSEAKERMVTWQEYFDIDPKIFEPQEVVTIQKEIEFDAGHRVYTHTGKCRFPHGHRYRVIVSCSGEIIDDPDNPYYGMLIDFGDLKKMMMVLIHDVLDHKFIVYEHDADMRYLFDPSIHEQVDAEGIVNFPYIPTAENIAKWCWEQLESHIENTFTRYLELDCVIVYETPTSSASYTGPRGG